MRKMNLLFVIDKLEAAGTQTNLLEIAKHLDRNQFSPQVVSLTAGGALEDAFRGAGVPVHPLKVKKAYGISGMRALVWLIRFIKKEKIQLVQTHFLQADLLGTLAAKLCGVKCVIAARRDEGFWRSPRQLGLNRFLNHGVDRFLVNSRAVEQAVVRQEKVSGEKIQVIHNGIDTERFSPSESGRHEARKRLGLGDKDLIIGMVANMRHEVKGHSYLLAAMAQVVKEFPAAHLVLVGEGSLRSSLEDQAGRLEIVKQVHFVGLSSENQFSLNAMDVVCSSSLSEGFSNSILEAMACAKPVVATKVGGNPEAVEEGVTGFLVPPCDCESLAGKILVLLRDELLRRQMGEAARRRVLENFSLEKMTADYEAFYSEALRPKRLKICSVIWSLELGGAEQIVIDLTTHLDRRFFEPIVCCLNGKGRFAPLLERLGIKVIALGKKPKFDPTITFKLASVLKKEKVDLVHTHLFTANLWGRMAAKLAGVRVVSSEHGMDVWRKRHHLALDRFLTPWNERIIFVSEAVRNFYQTRNSRLNGKGRVIHSGIKTTSFEPSESREAIRKSFGIQVSQKVIGIVGRLAPEKSHGDFVQAIEILSRDHKDIVGMIVGEGELEGELRACAVKAGIQDRIIFTGFRGDVAQLYPAMDVFVMTSLREGIPLTILEAMGAGTPVVATDVGGIKECIHHGEDGFLVPAQDPMRLAEAISRVLGDEKLRAQFIERGREKVRNHFNLERMVRDHESLYEEVCAS